MACKAHLVLIETASNQGYIFATNRLREQVGGSEIIRRIGTRFVLEAVARESGRRSLYDDDPKILAQNLTDPQANPPITHGGGPGVEVIVATSGKALLLVKQAQLGRAIVSAVTERTLREAPGAVVRGVVGTEFVFGAADELHRQLKDVHDQIEPLRRSLPAPEARFPMLPVLRPCDSSGLPASRIFLYGRGREDEDKDAPRPDDCSAPVAAKREARLDRWMRFKDFEEAHGHPLARDIERLEDLGCDWLGYVHADGNGLGQIFLNFHEHRQRAARPEGAQAYVEDYRALSLALDQCTEKAFLAGLEHFEAGWYSRARKRVLPIAPLILGGDDLTVVCDGARAIRFAATFLQEFEEQTGKSGDTFGDVLPAIGKAATGTPGLSACAGVAIVKPHFPAHRAYELAEALVRSAKEVKSKVSPACCALDFHVHFDSSGADLGMIREAQIVDRHERDDADGHTELTAKPYVLTPLERLQRYVPDDRLSWVANRLWTSQDGRPSLLKAAEALRSAEREDDGREMLPRNQQHYLREGLFLGRRVAAARLRQIRHRYRFPWRRLHPAAEPTLFFQETDDGRPGAPATPVTRTWLLDALELAEIMGDETP